MKIINVQSYRVLEAVYGGFDFTERIVSVEPIAMNAFGHDVADELSIIKYDDCENYHITYSVGDNLKFDVVTRMNHDIWRAAWRKFRRLRHG